MRLPRKRELRRLTRGLRFRLTTTYALFFMSPLLLGLRKVSAAFSEQWHVWVTDTLYWIVPKSAELGQAVFMYVAGGQLPDRVRAEVPVSVYFSTAGFAVACLAIASWLFTRKEF